MSAKLRRTLIGLLLFGVFGGVPGAAAGSQVNIGVSPSIIELAGRPGAIGEQTLTVSNAADTPISLAISVDTYDELPDQYSAVEWVSLGTTRVNIGPGSSAPIQVSFAVPDDAATGGAYAQVLIASGTDENGQPVGISTRLSVGVLFEISGDGEFRQELTAGHLTPTLEQDGRVGFRGEVTNDGNTLASLTGQVELTADGDDDPTASLQFGQTRVFPTLTAAISADGTLPLPIGSTWEAHTTISPGDPGGEDAGEPIDVEQEFTVDPQLEITASICENLDRGPTVTFTMANTGTIGLLPLVSIVLVDSAGSGVASIDPREEIVAWPGEDQSIPIEGLEQLTGGEYTLEVTATIVQGLDPITTTVPFSIGGLGDDVAPLCGSEPASTPAD